MRTSLRARTVGTIGAAAIAVVLGLSACGSSGSSSSVTIGTAPATSSSGSTGSAAPSDSSGSATSAPDPTFTGSGSDDICTYAKSVANSAALNSNDLTEASFKQREEILGKLADKAPDEIKSDVQKVQAAYSEVEPTLKKYGFDLQKIVAAAQSDPAVAAQLAKLNSADLTASVNRLGVYLEQVCGIKGS
jgi:hypothetical protein